MGEYGNSYLEGVRELETVRQGKNHRERERGVYSNRYLALSE